MAREEHHREDLLREATALVERVELALPTGGEPLVVGFRRDGSPSFFFGPEFVLQFNSRGELRRAYFENRLVKADQQQLWFLDRERTSDEVVLRSRPLTPDECDRFMQHATRCLADLSQWLGEGTCQVLRCEPPDAEVVTRVHGWLNQRASSLRIAASPRVR